MCQTALMPSCPLKFKDKDLTPDAQAIRSKRQHPRLYVFEPLPLAAAIGLQARNKFSGSYWIAENSISCALIHLLPVQNDVPQAQNQKLIIDPDSCSASLLADAESMMIPVWPRRVAGT